MSIVAECPHCETRFNLQPDLVGKSMRCPNLDCRQVFTVQPVKPARPAKPAKGKSGSVEEFVPVVEAKPAAKPRPKPAPAPKAKPAPPAASGFEVVEGEDAGPKEVVWSGGAAPPLPPGKAPPPPPAAKPAPSAARSTTKPTSRPVVRPKRKKKKAGGTTRLLMLGGAIVVLVGLGVGLYSLITGTGAQEEAKMAEEAKAAFDQSKFTDASKQYDELLKVYPESDDKPKYEFYSKLAALHIESRNSGVRADPKPAVDKFNEFHDKYKESPLAKPSGEGAGKSVLDAGRAVVEAVAGHAQDKLTNFKSNRAKTEELDAIEKMLGTGNELVGKLAPFTTSGTPPNDLADKLNQVKADVEGERRRQKTFAEVRTLLLEPTDANIDAARALLDRDAPGDPDAANLLKAAQGEFLKRIAYAPDPAAPKTPPAAATPSLLFVAPIGATRPRSKEAAATEPAVFLAVARGILYAIDEGTGNQLWTARVGSAVEFPPPVAALDLDGAKTDVAVVAMSQGGEPGLAGVVLKTGKVRWYQTLVAPAAGPPAIVGTRAFVPLADARGTIAEVNLLTGERVGAIALGQRIGPGIAVRPDSGMLYVAADARRVFVVDVGRKPDEPDRVPPRCTQVFMTQHFAGTLKTPPIVMDPDGAGPGGGWMVLAQGVGVNAKLRAFALPPPAGGDSPAEITPTADVELPFDGQTLFPPASDGERLALVSDLGAVQFYGVNQPGNADTKAVFLLPSPPAPKSAPTTDSRPGLVVPGEEGSFWVLSDGRMQKYRLALIPSRGLEAVAEGRANPIGRPSQPAQLNRRRDAACFVVRSPDSAGIRAVLVNLRDGEIRWKRQLGITPPVAPLVGADGVTVTDEDGGVFTLPAAAVEVPAGVAKTVPPEFATVAAPDNVTGPTRVAASLDGKTIFTITPVEVAGAPQLVVRRVVGGKLEHTGAVKAPGALAGSPAVVGGALVFAASDGFLHRHVPGDMKNRPDTIVLGSRWADSGRGEGAECFLTPVADATFVVTDGGRKMTRWDWPAAAKDATAGGAAWEVRERVALPPLFLPPTPAGAPARLLVADVTGSVWLFQADRGGNHTRRWSPGVALPPGRLLGRFAFQAAADGKQRVVFAMDREKAGEPQHVVAIDVEVDTALWTAQVSADDVNREIVGSPQPAEGGKWLVTDQVGRLSVLDPQTGKAVVAKDVGLPGSFPSMSAVTAGKDRVLCPLSDGSAAVVSLADAPAEPPKGGEE